MSQEIDLAGIHRLAKTSPTPFDAAIPGSKSYTNRALVLAAQRPGETAITGALHCDDTRYLAECLTGFPGIRVRETGNGFVVRREAKRLRAPERELYTGAAGTPARFLLSFAAMAEGSTVVTGTPRLCERPMVDLLDAFEGIGIRFECLGQPGCLPVRVHGSPILNRSWSIHGGVSSQFLSSLLLLAAQQSPGTVEVQATGNLVSRPYVRMTLRMLADHGIEARELPDNRFAVEAGVPSHAEIPVEVDASGMSYFLVAAAITGSSVRVRGIRGDSAQGDVGLARALERMGCRLQVDADSVLLEGGPLRGIEIDMETMPDTVLSLAIAAALAQGETHITNIANLRLKECDRIHAAAAELQRLGVEVEEGEDSLRIRPTGTLTPARIHTYDDHRVAMSFGLLRLLFDGIEIEDPSCVSKSFPAYWDELARFVEHHEGSGRAIGAVAG